jgi:hypothetical protein
MPARAGEAEMIYGLWCSLLHQGRALPHGGAFPLAFVSDSQVHNVSIEMAGQRVDFLSLPGFVGEMTQAAESWYAKFGETGTVTRNYEKFARLRPEGLPPHISGIPSVA